MATRAQQLEILAAGVLYDGAVIATPYAAFFATGTSTPKNAYADIDKAVAITKKALDSQGRAVVYGDGIYDIKIYSGDPDAGGVLKFTVTGYKVTAVTGNARTITTDTTGTDDDQLVLADTTSGNINYTLPSAVNFLGKPLILKKIAAGNTLTYTAASGQTIDGAASGSFTDNNATVQLLSNGVNWYGSQIVGTASTLGGYAANTGTTASTIPVRDGDGKLPGDILGNAATATLATTATTATKHGVLNVTVINIGDWNMDTTASIQVPITVDASKIRSASAIILHDTAVGGLPIDTNGSGYFSWSSTNFVLVRSAAGTFDSTDYDSTSFNRGYITVWYVD